MTGSMAAQLADAVHGLVERKGSSTPAVRGAEWRTGVVTAVGTTAGTVDVGDVRARRLESYQSPSVGDLIVITQSGSGNWVALGRTSTGADTAWANIGNFSANWSSARTNGGGVAQYRLITVAGTPYLELSGEINYSGSLGTGSATPFTLPVGARPSSRRGYVGSKTTAGGNTGKYRADINTDGTVVIWDHAAAAATSPWFFLDGCRVRMD